ncbi:MAG: NAD(P)/FAD-dependent oxidoreductase [Synergistaceae bacterium]|jgi:NADPH-dependent 2,4-dienoyl-CoA reductase/sulfur reductase-like enzyme|nr:NAD(P)/FAD-dependent oxidoreductase [Synergistaceae bacterium]
MKKTTVDIAIIGGGPAGLAAAVKASRLKAGKILVIERDGRLGGILNQCIHDGFGVIRYEERLTGNQYAQRFIKEVRDSDVESLVDTMALEITPDRVIYASNRSGISEITAGAIILAMGCRERSRPQAFIPGTRPAGVYTAGLVQRFINVEGYLPGKCAVILGSGDIGLIMARRMKIENIEVEGVYEIMTRAGGLTRNVVQCLRDYDIPLHLSSTITKIHGKDRVEGVTVASVDADRKPIAGTERFVRCDLVVLSVGLIPENELSVSAGIEIDPATNGPIVDESMMTSVPGIFAAGNVVSVFDLVDYVSKIGETAARGACDFLNGERPGRSGYFTAVNAGRDVTSLLPQRLFRRGTDGETEFFLRVANARQNVSLIMESGGSKKLVARKSAVTPAQMVVCKIGRRDVTSDSITLHVEGAG